MTFSVIIPLYNKAPYVAKAIGSVLSQTFTDYELIVVDDGSKDDSAEIAAKAIEGRENCYLIRQENAGVSVARNNGVAASHGECLCFLDADDWWEPTFLEEMAKLIAEFPDAGIYGASYTIISEQNHKSRLAAIGVDKGFERGYIDYFKVYARGLYMPLWTGAVCVPRKALDSVAGFNPRLKMGEDFDLWVRIALNYKVALVNKPLSNYNQDVDSANRAIGTLPPPETQFSFCAGYLDEAKKRNPALKFTVEMVQIACLRSYYQSRTYHKRAKEVLGELDVNAHEGQAYAKYLHYPAWMTLMKDKIYTYLNRWIKK